jgi:hypothetical protein
VKNSDSRRVFDQFEVGTEATAAGLIGAIVAAAHPATFRKQGIAILAAAVIAGHQR